MHARAHATKSAHTRAWTPRLDPASEEARAAACRARGGLLRQLNKLIQLSNKVDVITLAVRNPSPGGIRTRVCTDPWSAPLLDMRQWSGAGLSTANIHGILSETKT